MLTRQEIFDRAARGLRSQGFTRSGEVRDDDIWRGSFGCMYTDPVGNHCAAGWVIVDVKVPPTHLSDAFDDLWNALPAVQDRIGKDDVNFVCALQIAHDEGVTPELMVSKLRGVAKHYGVDAKELGE